MKLAVVIPAYNEAKTIADVIGRIPRKIKGTSRIDVIVVDDNSSDNTSEVARAQNATSLRHIINLGYGGACMTGIKFAYNTGCDGVITMDADGQHDPHEIAVFMNEYLRSKANFISGSRLVDRVGDKMPLVRIVGNKFFSFMVYLMSGYFPTDSQSGYRFFDRKAMDAVIDRVGNGYEFTSELFVQIKANKLKIIEIPIRTIYLEERRAGQNLLNGINIFVRMLFRSIVG